MVKHLAIFAKALSFWLALEYNYIIFSWNVSSLSIVILKSSSQVLDSKVESSILKLIFSYALTKKWLLTEFVAGPLCLNQANILFTVGSKNSSLAISRLWGMQSKAFDKFVMTAAKIPFLSLTTNLALNHTNILIINHWNIRQVVLEYIFHILLKCWEKTNRSIITFTLFVIFLVNGNNFSILLRKNRCQGKCWSYSKAI